MRRSRSTRGLFIGRFQPLHKGHLYLIKRILNGYDEIILGVGSSQYSHEPKNPFTFAERYEMLRRTMEAEGFRGYHIIGIPDIGVHSQWVSHVVALVPSFDAVFTHDALTRRLFIEAGYKVLDMPMLERERYSGTEIRRRMLADEDWQELVPVTVVEVIEEIDGVSRVREIASQ